MSHQGSGSKEGSSLRSTAYHAGFPRQGLPSEYLATNIVHQATSETPHHPSRPPNFIQPWRIKHPSSRHSASERTYSPLPETRIPSMGNKNDSDKTPASLGNASAASSKDDLARTADGGDESKAETGRGSHEGRENAAPVTHPLQSHSADWQRQNLNQTLTQADVTVPQVVPLVTPAALADMGHLYKLPTSGSPSQPQLYPTGMFSPLYTSTSVAPLQYSSYVGPSAVQVTTVPTYSPYLGGYPLGYPVAAAQGAVGPGPYPSVESYSAMLASMGSQVQQAQGTRLPVSTFLPPGVIPLPYGSQLTHGVPSLGLLPKEAVQESVPTIGYLNQQLATPGILQSGHHVLTSLVPVSGSILSFPPRTEDESNRPDQSQEKERDQEQSAGLQGIKSPGEERNVQRESEALPFQRQTFLPQPHVTFDKPEDHRCKDVVKLDPALHSASVEYQLSPDRKPYSAASTRHGSVITAVSVGNDKSRQIAAQEEHYAAGEHSRWGDSASYHHPQEGAGPYPSIVLPTVQHSPQVRFHLSPSPQVRPSPTVTHTSSAETEEMPVPTGPTSTPAQMSYLISAADRVEQTPCLSQEVMAHSLKLEPNQSQSHHILATPQIPAPSFSNIPSYFTKGSVIQLASGELKRVEDIRTEDFVHSAEMCQGLKIDSSTVVRIIEHADNGVALISFLVGEHKAQVSLEAPMEHPFFVFGQGWSAVRPERSMKSYSLGCHKLAVGDVCVSLTVKDKNERWLHQPLQVEQQLLQQHQLQQHKPQQHQPQQLQAAQQQQRHSHSQLQQQIPMQSMFSGKSKESPSWSPEPKRPRLLEPVQEDGDWKGNTDPRPDMTWQREPQQHIRHLQSPSQSSFAAPPPVSVNVPVELSTFSGKITEKTDSNANTVLVRTTEMLAEDTMGKPSPRSDTKPLQPLKRRWSDPMHRAQLAADQEKYALSVKPTDSQ